MTRKRANNEGSVYKHDNYWIAAVTVPGTTRRLTRRAATQREAQRKRAELVEQVRRGEVIAPSSMTVAAWFEHWLGVVDGSVRQTTHETYAAHVRRLAGRLGATRLQALTAAHIEQAYRALQAGGLAPSTIRIGHVPVSRALDHAVALGLLPANPAKRVTLPRAPRVERAWLAAEQARQLVDAAREAGDRYWPVWAVAVATGLRRGELLGLRWADVDIRRRRLVVRQQRVKTSAGYVTSEPKTALSRRTVPLVDLALDAFDAQRAQQRDWQSTAPAAWLSDLVFTRATGEPLTATVLAGPFREALARAGLPPMRLHDLRHSTASIMIAAGVPLKVISTILGHSAIAITADLYGHLSDELVAAAGTALDRALSDAVASAVASAPESVVRLREDKRA